MRIPGVKTARAVSRWVQARVLGGAMILGYHRISDVSRDEYEVCVTPEHFGEQMAVVSKYAHPISLSKLVEHLKNGSLPARSIAVTFDDGYADNLYNAKPVLEKNNVPATVFVSTGYAGKEFWWDELERLVLSSRAEPRNLRLQLGSNPFSGNAPIVSSKAGEAADISHRRQFRHALYHFLLPLDVADRERSMDMIRSWSGLSSADASTHRSMNTAELLQLAEGGLIELGSHTRSHPMLPHLSLKRQAEEIRSGKKDLEDLLGKRVAGFAYPNGRATPDAQRIVKDAGFSYACTSLHDLVRPGVGMFELTRFWQRDVDRERFMKSLNLWMSLKSNHA